MTDRASDRSYGTAGRQTGRTVNTGRAGKKKTKKSAFWKGLLIAVMVAAVAILIGLIWFFNWLSDYEDSERHHVAENALAVCAAGDFETIASFTDVVRSGLESREVYAEEIAKLMSGKTLTYAKAFSYDRFEKPIYKIMADGKYVCRLVLRKDGKSRYNFDKYAVDYFTEFDFGSGKVAFLVPDYYQVYCNGVLLDESYIARKGLNTELLKYALTDSAEPSLARYEISGLTGRCDITAKDQFGGTVELTESGGSYSAEFGSRRFMVPSNGSVYVGGVRLGDRYRTEVSSGESGELSFAPMLFSDDQVTGYTEYRVDYLSPGTEFRVTGGSGEELSLSLGSDGVYRAGVSEYTVIAPEGAEVSAGGVAVSASDKWRTRSGIPVAELSSILPKYLPERPALCEYKFSVSGSEVPEVTVRDMLGDVHTLEADDKSTFSFDFSVLRNVEELTSLAVKRTKMYAECITSDMDHDTFMSYILPEQPMYSELKDNPYYFYTGHKKHWFENEKWNDLRIYGDNCFSCEVSFDYYIGEIRTDKDFVKMLPLDIRFWFVKYEGSWYMADWNIL